jgi:hypothetical protein
VRFRSGSGSAAARDWMSFAEDTANEELFKSIQAREQRWRVGLCESLKRWNAFNLQQLKSNQNYILNLNGSTTTSTSTTKSKSKTSSTGSYRRTGNIFSPGGVGSTSIERGLGFHKTHYPGQRPWTKPPTVNIDKNSNKTTTMPLLNLYVTGTSLRTNYHRDKGNI